MQKIQEIITEGENNNSQNYNGTITTAKPQETSEMLKDGNGRF